MSNSNSNTSSIGFGSLLTLLFIGLKLSGYITWSWWWVLAPTWIPIALITLIVIVALLFHKA